MNTTDLRNEEIKWAIIATWSMSFDGISKASLILQDRGSAADAAEVAIMDVEDNPSYTSVATGGLPNENGDVQLDAAFMNGDDLSVGAVGAMKGFKNPVKIARRLMDERFNNFLVGQGAETYASENNFERAILLTEKARLQWLECRDRVKTGLSAYDGHDTVGMVVLDMNGTIVSATSTSGLFMKKDGRLGDTALFGSGLYADSKIGGSAATGVGEDIMKGCSSFFVTYLMRDGKTPQKAAEEAVLTLHNRLKSSYGKARDISIICLDKNGNYGAASNIKDFDFVVATNIEEPKIIKATCVV